jgi:hypothetical protein
MSAVTMGKNLGEENKELNMLSNGTGVLRREANWSGRLPDGFVFLR